MSRERRTVETPVDAWARNSGWRVYKLQFRGLKGAADSLLISTLGIHVHMEYKQEEGTWDSQQMARAKEVIENNGLYFKTDDIQEAIDFLFQAGKITSLASQEYRQLNHICVSRLATATRTRQDAMRARVNRATSGRC